VICPRCQTQISDDAIICDECNFILDATFLGDNITNESTGKQEEDDGSSADDGDHTRVRRIEVAAPTTPNPEKQAAAPAPKAARLKAVPSSPSIPALTAPAAQSDEPPSRRISLSAIAAPPAAVNETVYELGERFKEFALSERLSTIGAVLFLLSLGLPWRWSEEEESVIGLFANAWPLGILAAVVAVAAYVRRDARLRPYKQELVLIVLLASMITAAGTAIYLFHSLDRTIVHVAGRGAVMHWVMTPHIGSGLAAVAALIMLIGSAAAYLGRASLRD
jgi:hypothetical protein